MRLLKLLRKANVLRLDTVIIDGTIVRAFGGGDQTGPSPVDRRKLGTEHTPLTDANGIPLAIHTAPANVSDHRQILSLVREFPKVGGTPGRPKQRPDHLFADRGYSSDATRAILHWMGIEPRIARRGEEHGSGLEKVRWVVERSISWIKGFWRMRFRYDRLGIIQDAWSTLAAAAVCIHISCEACV